MKPPRRKRYAGRRLAHDHKHRRSRDKGVGERIVAYLVAACETVAAMIVSYSQQES